MKICEPSRDAQCSHEWVNWCVTEVFSLMLAHLFSQLHISISPKNVKLNIDCLEVAEKPIKDANNVSTDGYEVLGKVAKSGGAKKQSATVSTNWHSSWQKISTINTPNLSCMSIVRSHSHPKWFYSVCVSFQAAVGRMWACYYYFFYSESRRSMEAICNIRFLVSPPSVPAPDVWYCLQFGLDKSRQMLWYSSNGKEGLCMDCHEGVFLCPLWTISENVCNE